MESREGSKAEKIQKHLWSNCTLYYTYFKGNKNNTDGTTVVCHKRVRL